jgi:integrase
VFVTELGKPIHPGDLTKRFQAACRSVGARVIRLHEIRHTCATLALAANVHPKVVQERLGHSSIQITLDTYSHTMPSMQTQAATAIETVITGRQLQ